MVTAKKLLLGHATADRPVAHLLRETLVLGRIANDAIFHSSSRGSGIPSGADVRSRLRTELQRAGLVVELITPMFLTRPMCLMGLGGAWALGVATHPIVVPPLERTEVTRQIGDVHMGLLGSDSDIDEVFDELHDRLESDIGVRARTADWNRATRTFKQRLAPVLAASPPTPQSGAAPSARAASDGPCASPTAAPNSRISLADIGTSGSGMSAVIHGEATNNDSTELSATLRASLCSKSGEIVATFQGTIMQIVPGETKTFTINTFSGVPEHDRIKVQVDTIVGRQIKGTIKLRIRRPCP